MLSANLFSFSCLFFGLNQIAKRRDKLLNYMLFLRITPTLPNLFINLASPIVDVPFHIFFFATLIGLVPASYITVRVSFSSYLTVIFTIFSLFTIFYELVVCRSECLCCMLKLFFSPKFNLSFIACVNYVICLSYLCLYIWNFFFYIYKDECLLV